MNAKAIRALLGLLIIGISVLGMTWAFLDLVRLGSCGSDGTYVAPPCPPGTGGKIFSLVGGIFGLLIGGALTAGPRGWLAAWGLGFGSLAAVFFVTAFGPAASPDMDATSKAVSVGVGGLFALMALPALLAAVAPTTNAERQGFPNRGSRRIVMASGGTSTSNTTDFWSFNQGGGPDAGNGWGSNSDSGSNADSGGSDSGSSGCSSGCGGGCGGGGD